MNRFYSLLPVLMVALLTACGGGGGGASAPNDPYQPPADTTAPVITLTGDNPATVEINSTYTDAGATSDGGETVSSSGEVDTGTVGEYTITYSATDAAGNTGTATRTVNVVDSGPGDTAAPVITLNGDNPQTEELNATYTEAGATTDTGESVTIDSSAVDTSTVGSFEVIYSAVDDAGNTAIPVVRVVNVVDPSASATKLSVLTAVVDEIVIPNYNQLATQTAPLAGSSSPIAAYCSSIGTDDEAAKLEAAREDWKSIMKTVQKTEMHIFGQAALNNLSLRNRVYFYLEKDRLVETVSTCATDVAVVNAWADNQYRVSASSANQRSMSALEYLLFNDNLDHTCAANVSAVSDWNALSVTDRKVRRCGLSLQIANDVAMNAEQIHATWLGSRDNFLDPNEVGTRFELMTDGLFYFEKHTKSAKLNGPIGVDALCPDEQLTCPDFVESPFSETSLQNIKVNAEQLLEIFDKGLDDLANESASYDWSSSFKGLISAVINKIAMMQSAAPNDSLVQQVARISSANDSAACQSAFNSPEVDADLTICSLGGLVKNVTDDLKIEFITYLGVDLPEGAGGDTD